MEIKVLESYTGNRKGYGRESVWIKGAARKGVVRKGQVKIWKWKGHEKGKCVEWIESGKKKKLMKIDGKERDGKEKPLGRKIYNNKIKGMANKRNEK